MLEIDNANKDTVQKSFYRIAERLFNDYIILKFFKNHNMSLINYWLFAKRKKFCCRASQKFLREIFPPTISRKNQPNFFGHFFSSNLSFE